MEGLVAEKHKQPVEVIVEDKGNEGKRRKDERLKL